MINLTLEIEKIKTIVGDIKFFIAGGAVLAGYDPTNPKNTNDIDIYFYSENDFEKIKPKLLSLGSEQSYNAINCYMGNGLIVDSRPLQFIHCSFGTPQDVFDTFDFNCCKIAYTSDNELIKDKTFSNKFLIVDLNNIHSDIINRYIKYVNIKSIKDKHNLQLNKIIDFALDDVYAELKSVYGKEYNTTRLDILSVAIRRVEMTNDEMLKIYNTLVENYQDEMLLKCLIELVPKLKIPEKLQNDEYIMASYLYYNKNLYEWNKPWNKWRKLYEKHTPRLQEKYPEYFI